MFFEAITVIKPCRCFYIFLQAVAILSQTKELFYIYVFMINLSDIYCLKVT
jgi:hypothetical protein